MQLHVEASGGIGDVSVGGMIGVDGLGAHECVELDEARGCGVVLHDPWQGVEQAVLNDESRALRTVGFTCYHTCPNNPGSLERQQDAGSEPIAACGALKLEGCWVDSQIDDRQLENAGMGSVVQRMVDPVHDMRPGGDCDGGDQNKQPANTLIIYATRVGIS